MPVATLLAIAATFWGGAGYTVPPQTWDWEVKQAYVDGSIEQGHAYMGSNHVTFNRVWWDTASDTDRCSVAIHETGHAAFSFEHKAGTVMDPDGDAFPPGICKRNWTTPTTRVRAASENSKQGVLHRKPTLHRGKLASRRS